ncbi:amino acid adenylation domain-containing protein [Priestia megaterium]|uniref:amino acid adenylation domain-containing protein n=1 Tax=Priestia megaterium TaxID=1404 RepID=UPI0026756B1E|nr:amino acid adenylation domain-containing protein [Priestia megaterium]WKU21406.1 amino acid adenylation domain-containing protein [Priestia megaterium]
MIVEDIFNKQLSYWKKQLSGEIPLIQVPRNKHKVSDEVDNISKELSETTLLSELLTAKLQNHSEKFDVSLEAILLATFSLLLYRYTNQKEFLIGKRIKIENINSEENTKCPVDKLLIHSDLKANLTFKDLIKSVNRSISDAEKNFNEIFDQITKEFPYENKNHHLNKVLFDFHHEQYQTSSSFNLDSLNYPETPDINLSITYSKKGLHCTLKYNSDFFSKDFTVNMLNYYINLLQNAFEDIEQEIYYISIFNDKDYKRIITEWNETDFSSANKCLHQIFEEIAANYPNNTAVVCNEKEYSYKYVNEQANRLARFLLKQGVDKESIIGVCLDKSAYMIISLLGILKSGAAYMPLDPSYPTERLELMIKSSNNSLTITQQEYKDELPVMKEKLIILDNLLDVLEKEEPHNLNLEIDHNSLCYVIYTSGSTGVPKGIALRHQGVLNNLNDLNQRHKITSKDKVLAISSFSFDMSVYETLGVLIAGGTCVVPNAKYNKDPKHWAELIDKYKVTIWNSAPPLLESLVDYLEEHKITDLNLKVAFLGGDWIPLKLPARIKVIAPKIKVIGFGGNTELSIHSIIQPINKINPQWKSVPYGKPMYNQKAYILNDEFQPLPIGGIGELYLSGIGLARGYLNSPDLTAEKFLPNPFSKVPGERMYRTGDLAKYHTDGTIEFLGRKDHQVKVKGYRIELGEIEFRLKQFPNIDQAVCLANKNSEQESIINAYIVNQSYKDLNINELNEFLIQKIPYYMLPEQYYLVDEIPLSPNGKVDRKALLKENNNFLRLRKEYSPPTIKIEETILNIWKDVLNKSYIGIEDSLFSIGVNSLLIAKIANRINQKFNCNVPISMIFKNPTVSKLALIIENYEEKEFSSSSIEPYKHSSNKNNLSFLQKRFWFLDQLEGDKSVSYNIFLSWNIKGKLKADILCKSINEIIKRQESLRTNFLMENGELIQVIRPSLTIDIPISKPVLPLVTSEKQETITSIAKQEANKRFDLSGDPLIRARLVRVKEDEHILMITMHHIISDGWSIKIFTDELKDFYESLINEADINSNYLPIQYRDYVIWKEEQLNEKIFGQQLSYWKRKLAGELPVLKLPTETDRISTYSFKGATNTLKISENLTNKLKETSKNEQVTLYMTLLAAYNILLYRFTNQSDILIGTPIANRNLSETDRVIGCFVNTLIMRNQLADNPTFLEFLKRVEQTALEAYNNQDVPFETLVKEINPNRDLNHNPLFQAWFVYNEEPISNLKIKGLCIEPLKVDLGTTNFDLSLTAEKNNNSLDITLHYNSFLISKSKSTAILNSFYEILNQIITNPNQNLNTLIREILTNNRTFKKRRKVQE